MVYEKNSAFTLIELMIVIAIIALLATIALPNYSKYMAKAKQAEVALNLGSLHAAEQAYFTQHGHYSPNLSGENSIGWEPAGYSKNGNKNFLYTYGFYTTNATEGKNFFVGKLNTTAQNLKNSFAKNDTFIAAAAGKIGSSDKIDIWTIDENRNIVHLQDALG